MQIYWNILVFFATSTVSVLGDIKQDVVYEFSSLTFESVSGVHSSSENVVTGIQVYNDTVYVNIPRLTPNVPVTLATVAKKNGKVVFKPFPTLQYQELGNCNALQSVGAIRVVRKTNLLYIADNKYLDCNAKLIIFDLVKRTIKKKYEFSSSDIDEKLNSTQFEDIVVDGAGNAYIANAGKPGSIIVYRNKMSKSFVFHDRMLEIIDPVTFKFGNDSYNVNQSISEMTLSPDDDYLFFVIHYKKTVQVPTKSFEDIATRTRLQKIRTIGTKLAKGFGMLMGRRYMYLTGVEDKVVYVWDRNADLEKQKGIVKYAGLVTMETQKELKVSPELSLHPGKMSFDNHGNLWIITTDYQLYFRNSTEGEGYETKIVKLKVDDSREKRTTSTAALDRKLLISLIIATVMLCIVL
ncbi:Hypothetical predicted protein [Octopus vulgaris]|uniref:Uncharacterized protein n=1 Tax=Octopus vulgaris TaxID=6645 RepID=A0AA36FIU5_OCTVU|nr:Hypothetical predicted protein [Octopus vulgaris]